ADDRAREFLQTRLERSPPARRTFLFPHRPEDGLRPDACIDAPAAIEATLGVRIVEVMHDTRHLRTLVFVERMLEHGADFAAGVEHEVLAYQSARIAQSIREATAGGIEQQPRR